MEPAREPLLASGTQWLGAKARTEWEVTSKSLERERSSPKVFQLLGDRHSQTVFDEITLALYSLLTVLYTFWGGLG